MNSTQNDIFAIAANTQTDLLLQGEVDAIVDSSRNVAQMVADCECDDFAFAIPDDGFLADYDAMVIPTNAVNPALAHAFMDYMHNPQVSADVSNAVGSITLITEGYPLLDEAVLNNGISYIAPETLMSFIDQVLVVDSLVANLDFYIETWNNVKAELASQ